jgi:HD-like signal output (HDOD) protein
MGPRSGQGGRQCVQGIDWGESRQTNRARLLHRAIQVAPMKERSHKNNNDVPVDLDREQRIEALGQAEASKWRQRAWELPGQLMVIYQFGLELLDETTPPRQQASLVAALSRLAPLVVKAHRELARREAQAVSAPNPQP